MTQFIAQNLAPIMFAGLFVFLLLLQGLSELIKRIAFLQGLIPDPTVKIVAKTPEEELAEEIRRQAELAEAQKNRA